jgi:hypothetical protein
MARDEGEQKKKSPMNRLKELRSAFQGLTGHAFYPLNKQS